MTTLPLLHDYTMRPPTAEDAAAVARVRAACQAADGDKAESDAEDVLSDWKGIELPEEAIVVAGPDGDIVACADILNRRNVLISVYGGVHPGHRGRGLGSFLVGWGEAWAEARLHHAPADAEVAAQHYIRATNATGRRLMARHGYAPVRSIYVMGIALDEPPPPPDCPPGLVLRAFVPGRDERATFDAVEEAFRDQWGRPPGVFERWLGLTEGERRDPGLWSLAEDEASGAIVGACLGKAVSGSGWIGGVGVRRPWRGRGLALALLRRTFGEFHRRGVRTIELSVDSESATGAPRLYARAGMRLDREYLLHRKVLRPGRDLTVPGEPW